MDKDISKSAPETEIADTWLHGHLHHHIAPSKFSEVGHTMKQVKEKGEVRVVPSNDRDFFRETQSHAKEVGIENIFQTMPDGSIRVNPANMAKQPPMFGDFTSVPRYRSGALPYLQAGNAALESLKKTFPGIKWEDMGIDEVKATLDKELLKMRDIANALNGKKEVKDE